MCRGPRRRSRRASCAFGRNEDPDEIATPTRTFTLAEITSGLPDDSREADERAEARRLRELRARVNAASATLAASPGAAEVTQRDWQRAARFYTRFGLTEDSLLTGAQSVDQFAESSASSEEAVVLQDASGLRRLAGRRALSRKYLQ